MSAKEWKEFENNEITHSMAHYLMAIQELLRRQGYARVTDVARELEITPGSASVSIKHLKTKGWVEEDHNRFLRLSSEGERIAQEIRVNNRLLVQFLTEVLGLPEPQANIDACKVEHLVSSATRSRMMALMTFIHKDTPVVKKFLHAWRESQFECPGPAECPVCEEGESCAIHPPSLIDKPPGTT
jgi:Mn-dependent DtxR family transcriptional regulator